MGNATSDWEDHPERWLKPFLDRLGHRARRRMCPRYIAGLIGPGCFSKLKQFRRMYCLET